MNDMTKEERTALKRELNKLKKELFHDSMLRHEMPGDQSKWARFDTILKKLYS